MCTERGAGCRAQAFVRVFGCNASKAEVRLVNSNRKRKAWAVLHIGVFFKGFKGRHWRQGDLVTRRFEKSYEFMLLLEFKAIAGCMAK